MDEYLNIPFRTDIQSQASASYINLQLLGKGGTAETYLMLARTGPLRGQLFAVKVFRRLSKPAWRANFLDEVKFLLTCDHPAVMRVFDEGLYLDEFPFVVAEYLPGTLANVLRTSPTMMAKLGFAVQLLSALDYLGNEKIAVVHRDIKPLNIFIKGGSCVLGDFGLMKREKADPEIDQAMLKESVGPKMPRLYRTPDLVAYYKGGPPPTTMSDVFQTGLVFAEIFSGSNPQRPMEKNDFAEDVVLNKYFIPGGLGKPIKDLIEPMLNFDPTKRPSTHELLAAWQDLFMEAAQRSLGLEGKVF